MSLMWQAEAACDGYERCEVMHFIGFSQAPTQGDTARRLRLDGWSVTSAGMGRPMTVRCPFHKGERMRKERA